MANHDSDLNFRQHDGEPNQIDPETGEVIEESNLPMLQDTSNLPALSEYYGISQQSFAKEQQKKLEAPLKEDEIEIDPQGMLYFPQVRYRKRLNDAFGTGAWAIRPREMKVQGNTVVFIGELWAEGRFVAWAPGEQEYHENNPNMSYATALEAAKSDCITRCCKDLGIATELWDPTFIRQWKEKNAVQVWCERDGKKKPMWRRKDYPPFEYPWKEIGVKKAPTKPQDAPQTTQKEQPKTKFERAIEPEPKPQSKSTDGDIKLNLEQKKKLIWEMLLQITTDPDMAKDKLKNITKGKGKDGKQFDGIDDVKFIKSDAQAGFIIGKIKPEFIKQFTEADYKNLETMATTKLM